MHTHVYAVCKIKAGHPPFSDHYFFLLMLTNITHVIEQSESTRLYLISYSVFSSCLLQKIAFSQCSNTPDKKISMHQGFI